MRKRPLCLLAVVLIIGIYLAERQGVGWIWRSPAGSLPDWYADENRKVQVEGTIEKQEQVSYCTYLYLSNATLIIQSKKFPIRKIKCELKSRKTFLAGQKVKFAGNLSKGELPGNPGEFHQLRYEQARKIDYHLENAAVLEQGGQYSICSRLLEESRKKCAESLERIFPQPESGILCAMILGIKSQVDEEIKEGYQYAGISHIMAISGLHVTLLGMGIWKITGILGMGIFSSASVSMGALLLYGIWIGGSASAFRAIVMFLAVMGAKLTGRSYDFLSSLALAAVILLADNPDQLFDSGFQLSFMAVLGIGGIAPLFHETKRKQFLFRLISLLRPGVILWFTTLPVVLCAFSQVSVAGLAINLLVIPLLSLTLVSGILAMLTGLVHTGIAGIAGIPAWGTLELYEWMGRLAGILPAGMWTPGQPETIRVWLYYLVGAGMIAGMGLLRNRGDRQKENRSGTFRRLLLPLGSVILMLLLMGAVPYRGIQVTMMDVGQGDAILLGYRNCWTLVDGGSTSRSRVGTYVIWPYLKSQGITRLEAVFVTHDDEDHISGIRELLDLAENRRLKITFFFMPEWMEETKAGKELKEKAEHAGIACYALHTGDVIKQKECISFKVLHPPENRRWADSNDGSLTLLWECEQVRGILTGDLTSAQERKIVLQENNCDFLKVGHHGAEGSSSPEFLEKADPEIGLISCGKDNPYGHPADTVLHRLTEQGCTVYRTDLQGAVTVRWQKGEPGISWFSRKEA